MQIICVAAVKRGEGSESESLLCGSCGLVCAHRAKRSSELEESNFNGIVVLV